MFINPIAASVCLWHRPTLRLVGELARAKRARSRRPELEAYQR